ncbi:ribonuclease H-like domain-containing protein [Tanacetum coccineum]
MMLSKSSIRAATLINIARPVNTDALKPKVNDVLPITYSYFKAHSPVRRTFNQKSAAKTNNFNKEVNTARVNNVTTAGPKTVVSAAKGNGEDAIKSSACWIWRPTGNVIDHISKDSRSYMLKRFNYVDLQGILKSAMAWDQGIFDSGCSRHMTGNKSFLIDYQEIDGGFVVFGGSPKGGKITRKGKIKTGKLDFEDVYFVKELKFNLSVSQMCDTKNNVLFTEAECLVLSLDFKQLDESQVLLKVPRHDNMYSFDLKNVVPLGGLTCLFAKATIDESNLWHGRLGHINFKTMNKLVKGNLVRGLPSKIFENDHTCVACQKGKQHKASCKHAIGTKWIYRNKKDERGIVVSNKARLVAQGYTQEERIDYDKVFALVARIEAIRLFLAYASFMGFIVYQIDMKSAFLYGTIEEEYVANLLKKVEVGFCHSKVTASTPIESNQEHCSRMKKLRMCNIGFALGIDALLGFVLEENSSKDILKTEDIQDDEEYANEGFLVGYSINSKAFRVFNTRTRKVEENLHITFLENKPNVAGSGPDWLFDIDLLTNSMNYEPVTARNQTNGNAGIKDNVDAKEGGASNKEGDQNLQDLRDELDNLFVQQKQGYANNTSRVSTISPSVSAVRKSFINANDLPTDPFMSDLEDATDLLNTGIFSGAYNNKDVGAEADLNNLETTMNVYVDDIIFGSTKKSLCVEFEQMMHKRFQMSSMVELTFFLGLQVKQKDDGIFISQDKYVADILKKFDFVTVKTASTLIETNKALLKDEEAEDVDVHLYKSMIRSLMYLTASRPDIMFAVCACARFQVTPKVSHLHVVKMIFRYLKGQHKLGLWYPRDSPFDLEAFFDSDYARASLDRKSTTGGVMDPKSNA